MSENIKCLFCGNTDIKSDVHCTSNYCRKCDNGWLDFTPPQSSNVADTGDKAECINLYEEAVDLIDSLNSEQRIDYGDYSLLRDAVDAIGNCIEEKRQPPNAWVACSERLPEELQLVLVCVIVGERAPFAEPAYHEDGWWWPSDGVCGWPDNEASHWMPLPDLPQPPATRKDGE